MCTGEATNKSSQQQNQNQNEFNFTYNQQNKYQSKKSLKCYCQWKKVKCFNLKIWFHFCVVNLK